MSRSGRRDRPLRFGPGVPDDELAHPDNEMACFTCHLSWTTSCAGCHLPIEANWRTTIHHYRGRGDPQLRDLQSAGRARRHVPARPAPDHQGQHHRADPLDLGAGPVLDQHQPRADLRPAAADLVGRLLEPGLRAAFPAHRAHDRDQDLLATATCRRSERQQCDHGAAAAAGHQLRQLRRPARLGRPGGRLRGGAGDRMGRAAGGDRLLPAPLRLSRFLPAARRPQQARADQLDPRRDLRRAASPARPARSSSSPTSSRARADRVGCLQHRGEYMFVAEGSGGFRVYDIASIANKGFSERIVTAPFSPLGHDTHVDIAQRDLHGAADQPADRPERNEAMAATRRPSRRPHDQPARGEPGAALPPDLQLCGGDRRRGGADPRQRQHAGRRRAAQQQPRAAP